MDSDIEVSKHHQHGNVSKHPSLPPAHMAFYAKRTDQISVAVLKLLVCVERQHAQNEVYFPHEWIDVPDADIIKGFVYDDNGATIDFMVCVGHSIQSVHARRVVRLKDMHGLLHVPTVFNNNYVHIAPTMMQDADMVQQVIEALVQHYVLAKPSQYDREATVHADSIVDLRGDTQQIRKSVTIDAKPVVFYDYPGGILSK